MSDILMFIPWFQAPEWKVGPVPIHPFGILVAIGVLLGAKIAELRGERAGLARSVVADFGAHIIIAGFIASYFLNAVFYEPEKLVAIARDPSVFFEEYLGLSSFGGFIGAAIGLLIWRKRRKLPVIPVADATAFAFPFGWLFGRTGCFVTHDHPGCITDFVLAVDNYRGRGAARHDLGLYEVFWSATAICVFLVLGRKQRKSGFYLALLPLMYAPVRFCLDYLRAGPEDGGDVRYFALTPGQYWSVALLIAGLAMAWWVRTRPEAEPPKAVPHGD